MKLDLRIDVSRAKAASIGSEHGITPAELRTLAARVRTAHEILQQERQENVYGFWDLYKDEASFQHVKDAAAEFLKRGYDNFVVLGIGGSALGTKALVTALKPPYYNLLTRRVRKGFPRIFVMDNIDPVTLRWMLRLCPPRRTLFNAVSKSGGAAETLAQTLVVVERIEKQLGSQAVADHLVVTTSPRQDGVPANPLQAVADAYNLKQFTVPPNVGGRFSVFSPVGTLPAAMVGIDLDELREGCAAMDRRCSSPNLRENPAYLRAAVQYLADTKKGKVMSVMMPYADGLVDVADWYRQLWAESLGKRLSLDGQEVSAGQTPLKALGVTDQHSQVQLFREGPNNKLINVIEVRRFDTTVRIPRVLTAVSALDYLRGSSMNRLLAAELRGTIDALKLSQRPVSRIILPRLSAHAVAQLLYLLEVETAMAGRLYNVQTFDQPAVEEGKRIARRLMGGKD